jgi:hypothetical protein
MGDKSEVVPDPEVLKLYDELRTLQARMYTVTEELGRRLAGGERWATILKRLEAAFDTAWCSRYAPGETKKYQFHYVKDRPQWKRLYNRLGEPDLVERVGVFIRNNDQFFVHTTRHSFPSFVTSINQHVPPARHRIAEPRVWECPHLPKCGSESHCGNVTTINAGRRQRGAPLLVEERDGQNTNDQGGRGAGAADPRPTDDGGAQGARGRR